MKRVIVTLATMALILSEVERSVADPMTLYDIYVTVTDATNPTPSDDPFTFPTLPTTYEGTFTADATTEGPISNFALTVGGITIPNTFTDYVDGGAIFYPTPECLDWLVASASDANLFLDFTENPFPPIYTGPPGGIPPNAYGIEAEDLSGLIWSGAYWVIAANQSITLPEPSSAMLTGIGSTICLMGAAFRKRKERRRQRFMGPLEEIE